MKVDLNCDMGESFGNKTVGNDEVIMPFITSANIACGFHGGDPVTIEKTILLALKYGVGIGAHPGFYDLEGFGRRNMEISHQELRSSILYQVGALKSMTETLGGKLSHVKVHGALYNIASANFEMAKIITDTVKEIDPQIKIVCLSGSRMVEAAKTSGLDYVSEVFADRAYNDDGSLVSRNSAGALITSPKKMIERVLIIVKEKTIQSITGKLIPINADTICIHGDNENAAIFVQELSARLNENGITLSSFSKK